MMRKLGKTRESRRLWVTSGEELGSAFLAFHHRQYLLLKAGKLHAKSSLSLSVSDTVSDHCFYFIKNTGNFLHGGATATLVDLVGSAVIYTVGAPTTGVSVEINVSYLDAAYADVSFYPFSFLFFLIITVV
jgi:hypothetical protein